MIMKFAVYGDLFCNQPFYRLTWVNVLFALEKKEKHSVGKKKAFYKCHWEQPGWYIF